MSASTGRTPLASRLFAVGSGSTIRNDLTPRWEAGRRWRPCKQRWWELQLAPNRFPLQDAWARNEPGHHRWYKAPGLAIRNWNSASRALSQPFGQLGVNLFNYFPERPSSFPSSREPRATDYLRVDMVVEARSFPLHFGVELHRLRPRPEVTCSRGTHAQVATSLLKGGFVAFLQLECCSCDRAATELGVARRYFDQAWEVTAYLSRAIFAEAGDTLGARSPRKRSRSAPAP